MTLLNGNQTMVLMTAFFARTMEKAQKNGNTICGFYDRVYSYDDGISY
jgi:hypothetical protein